MAIAQLKSLLRSHSRIALDTSIFIYQLQAHPQYSALTNEIFTWLERPRSSGVTSSITMTELMVQPYRAREMDSGLQTRFRRPLLLSAARLPW